MKTFRIEPTNEGQDLNCIEMFKGTREEAIQRAKAIAVGLQRLLPKGSFGAAVFDNDTNDELYFGRINERGVMKEVK